MDVATWPPLLLWLTSTGGSHATTAYLLVTNPLLSYSHPLTSSRDGHATTPHSLLLAVAMRLPSSFTGSSHIATSHFYYGRTLSLLLRLVIHKGYFVPWGDWFSNSSSASIICDNQVTLHIASNLVFMKELGILRLIVTSFKIEYQVKIFLHHLWNLRVSLRICLHNEKYNILHIHADVAVPSPHIIIFLTMAHSRVDWHCHISSMR